MQRKKQTNRQTERNKQTDVKEDEREIYWKSYKYMVRGANIKRDIHKHERERQRERDRERETEREVIILRKGQIDR